MVLLRKTQSMQQYVLWEHLGFLYNCWIFPIEELILFSILMFYQLNEQVMLEKHVLGHMCHGLDN